MLARELGYTLNDLLDSLGDNEIELWYELHKTKPLSYPWQIGGEICATVAGYAGKVLKDGARVSATDFIPIFREPPTADQLYAKFLAMAAQANCEIIDRRSSTD